MGIGVFLKRDNLAILVYIVFSRKKGGKSRSHGYGELWTSYDMY